MTRIFGKRDKQETTSEKSTRILSPPPAPFSIFSHLPRRALAVLLLIGWLEGQPLQDGLVVEEKADGVEAIVL